MLRGRGRRISELKARGKESSRKIKATQRNPDSEKPNQKKKTKTKKLPPKAEGEGRGH